MKPHFLHEGPALLIENSMRVLVIADLHFGAETGFAQSGVHIPSNSPGRMERMLSCIHATNPDLLVLLGDVKHSIPMTSRQEYTELPYILRTIRKEVPLRVTPGNHDGGLQRFLEKDELLPINGALIDGVGYLHGHTFPAPELQGHLMVVGHHHTVIHLYDEVGCALRSHPAYLLARLDAGCLKMPAGKETLETRALFMPAFFELAGGLDIRELQKSKLSPLSRCIREEGAEVFLNDGTYIDTLTSLNADEIPGYA